jgi:hypothetical protein
MDSRFLVASFPGLYRAAIRFPGKGITQWAINNTFGKVLFGGNKIEDL